MLPGPGRYSGKKSCKDNSVTIRVLQHRAHWTDTTGKLSLVCFYPVKGSRFFLPFFWELAKDIAQSFNLSKPTESSNFIYLNQKKNILFSPDDQRKTKELLTCSSITFISSLPTLILQLLK